MIPVNEVAGVPVSRLLKFLPGRFRWSLGAYCAPSPRAPAARQAAYPNDVIVQRDGRWRDSYSGRVGVDIADLAAYCGGVSRTTALRRLADVLSPRDTMLDRAIRPGDTERAGPVVGDTLDSTSPVVTDARLAKFAARGTPRMRADALLRAATNARALDAVEDRKAGRR
jgi:hypothetical protein